MPDVALLLENAKRGKDRIVGEKGLAAEGRGDFPDSDCALSHTTSMSRSSASVRLRDFFRATGSSDN